MGDLSQLLSECASFVKTAWLAAAHAVTHHSGGPPACSGSPPGPKRRALAAWVQKRCCAGALVPAQSRRFHRLRPRRYTWLSHAIRRLDEPQQRVLGISR